MATAGIFTLITNDGKQDRMLMATQLLKRRLTSIKQARAQAGMRDTTPTLLDIERTHVLFMNAHFKPFAAIGFEYHKVQPDSSATLGSEVRFSIPQFGDFFSDMALYVQFDDVSGTTMTSGKTGKRLRYCDYPGERLLEKVKFDVNGNPLDEYNSDVYNFHRQFCVQPNKLTAWNRLVGQEEPRTAYFAKDESAAVEDNRTKVQLCDGFQTPKTSQKQLTVMVPLLFWFNKDPRLAVPSVSIPYGQRFLSCTLASSSKLLGTVVPAHSTGEVDTAPTLSIRECSLYINNIFVNPEVHDIFIKRIGFTLIRVHRMQTTRVTEDNKSVLLNNMKWPIEYMFVALKPVTNYNASNRGGFHYTDKNNVNQANSTHLEDWHRFSYRVTANTALALRREACEIEGLASGEAGLLLEAAEYVSPVEKLSVTAHGIDIYKEMPSTFFNAYTPYTYGGHNVNAPEDCGAHMITFCLYPGSYQPSGHVNVSRAREFYLKYWSSSDYSIGASDAAADLIVVASAINFLLISDGSAVLRYST